MMMYYILKNGFPGGSNGKESAGNAGDPVRSLGQEDPLVRKIPWGREWLLTPVFLPGESYRHRVWQTTVLGVTRESDTTEVTYHIHATFECTTPIYLMLPTLKCPQGKRTF